MTKLEVASIAESVAKAMLPTLLKVEPPTLRDQFAMAALEGLISRLGPVVLGGVSTEQNVAGVSYKIADAMLEARKE